MKLFVLLIGMLAWELKLPVQNQGDPQLISQIMHSNKFTISIERLDFGFMHNKQDYIFEKSEKDLLVTHGHLCQNYQDTLLDKTSLKVGVLDSLINFCSEIYLFQINHPRKHKRLFNKKGVHDLIYVQNAQDTILISDVHFKAINGLGNMIHRNKK